MGPSRAEPSRAVPDRAGPSRAEPSRAEPSRAGFVPRLFVLVPFFFSSVLYIRWLEESWYTA